MLSVEILGRLTLRLQLRVREKRISKRLEAGLAGDLRFGAALGFEGQVDVLEPGLGIGADDGGLQFRSQLALGGNRLKDRSTAVLQVPQVPEPFLELAQLGVIERPGDFLAVPGDERDGGSGVKQFNRGLDLPGLHAELFGDQCVDGGVC
ncbi:hypothetical protein AHiyo8_20500 [Arthrobacter sp. Hiyo8]|nr:hypothetical protein AHiyo8_20500 [Arthrobacter sp. Hiyo8]